MRQAEIELYPGVWVLMHYAETQKISTHFKFNELDNPSCGVATKFKFSQDAMKSLQALEYIRSALYKQPIKLSCCYREKAYNKSIGGVDKSLHTTAQAYDIQLGKSISDTEYNKWYKWVLEACVKYGLQAEIGRYYWGLHIGFATKLPYNYLKTIYEFDKR